MEDEIKNSIVLSNLKGIGKRTFKSLLERFETAKNVLDIKNREIIQREFGNNVFNILNSIKKEDFDKAVKELEKAQKLNIKIIPYSSREYPSLLKQIPDPPAVLYMKGNWQTNLNSISVVGTRNPSSYGKYIVENIVRQIAKNPVSIVSGFAYGIDSLSHKVALEEDCYTVAVLGNGIDIIYPPENRKLYYQIEEKGCIISEFPIGTPPSKYTFPMRNRIIAGLSYATFVVEAPAKSGSLITANIAFEYSRPVFTVPANINVVSATGNNKLIKENIAIPVTSAEDIFLNLPFLLKNNMSEKSLLDLSDKEKDVLEFLTQQRYIDEILERFNLDPEIDNILLMLQIKNLIKQEGNFYYRIG